MLKETTIQGFTFTPLTTRVQLSLIGRRMGNCLGTYWTRCQNGSARIFTAATGSEPLAAAVELVGYHNNWSSGHIEAPKRGKLPDGITQAAGMLADLYQAAADARQAAGPPLTQGQSSQ